MALSKLSCKKAIEIFSSIISIESKVIHARTEANQYNENVILGIGKKQDGGWESVFVNIKKPTCNQLSDWDSKKKEIHNSSSIHEVQPDIFRISFY